MDEKFETSEALSVILDSPSFLIHDPSVSKSISKSILGGLENPE